MQYDIELQNALIRLKFNTVFLAYCRKAIAKSAYKANRRKKVDELSD